MYIDRCIFIYIYTYIYINIYVSIYLIIYMYKPMHVYVHVHVRIYFKHIIYIQEAPMDFEVLPNRQSFRILICMCDVDICNTLQHNTTHCNTLGGANRFEVGFKIPNLMFSHSYIATWMCATHINTTHCNTTCGTRIFVSRCQGTRRFS